MDTQTQTLSPSSGGRRRIRNSDCTRSPEFEFWMVRNPSFPQPNILSADQLFLDGVLLPLHLLSTHKKPDPPHNTLHQDPETTISDPPDPGPASSAAITDTAPTAFSASKRWKDIFRKSEKKKSETNTDENETDKDKEKWKKNERKGGSTPSAELNINIWPFSRSRSAGNAGTRPKIFPGAPLTRKVNSAPCSRSNSAGESKSRKWPSSPGRAGVHLGRTSPVWQVRRGGSGSKNLEPPTLNPDKRETATSRRSKLSCSSGSGSGSGSSKARVLNLNVPMCNGYRQQLSCRSQENRAIGVSGDGNGNGNGNGKGKVGSKLFNLRSLFTKKGVLTSH